MQASELYELKQTVEGLTADTREGRLIWTEANKTTFVWLNPDNRGRLVLQRTGEGARAVRGRFTTEPAYQLQAIDPTSAHTGFTLSTEETSELTNVMHELFDVVQSSIAKKGISFLKSIVPPRS